MTGASRATPGGISPALPGNSGGLLGVCTSPHPCRLRRFDLPQTPFIRIITAATLANSFLYFGDFRFIPPPRCLLCSCSPKSFITRLTERAPGEGALKGRGDLHRPWASPKSSNHPRAFGRTPQPEAVFGAGRQRPGPTRRRVLEFSTAISKRFSAPGPTWTCCPRFVLVVPDDKPHFTSFPTSRAFPRGRLPHQRKQLRGRAFRRRR